MQEKFNFFSELDTGTPLEILIMIGILPLAVLSIFAEGPRDTKTSVNSPHLPMCNLSQSTLIADPFEAMGENFLLTYTVSQRFCKR